MKRNNEFCSRMKVVLILTVLFAFNLTGQATAAVYDNFRNDTSLDPNLWVTGSNFTSSYDFSNNGLTLSASGGQGGGPKSTYGSNSFSAVLSLDSVNLTGNGAFGFGMGSSSGADYFRITVTGGSAPVVGAFRGGNGLTVDSQTFTNYTFGGLQAGRLRFDYSNGTADLWYNSSLVNSTWMNLKTYTGLNLANDNNVRIGSQSSVGSAASFRALQVDITPTPIPAAAWLLGSGLLGLVGIRRRNS